jgi:mannose-6-phosphate isomerase-like protein (cupin superfamily)
MEAIMARKDAKKDKKQEKAAGEMPAWIGNHPFPPDKKRPTLITRDTELSTVYGVGPHRVAPRIYVSTDKILMSDFKIPPGGHFDPPDIHAGDEPYYIAKGAVTLVNPETGQTLVVKAGEAAWIPAKAWHAAYNFGMEECIVVAMIAGQVWDPEEMGSSVQFDGVPQYAKSGKEAGKA